MSLKIKLIHMEAKYDNLVIRDYSYEIIERITRFIIHLEEIKKQFYIDEKNASDKLNFINSYKESLFKILEIIITGLLDIDNNPDYIQHYIIIQKDSLKAINELHTEYLSILPRPIEPVELERFKRVINKQIVQLNERTLDISISVNESIGEEISLDPLDKYKDETINKLISKFNKDNSNKIEKIPEINKSDKLNLHITIPRIDAGNTYRWSSLIHEMCHYLMKDVFLEYNSIENDFKIFIENDSLTLNFFLNKIESPYFNPNVKTLNSWLTECWCDLFSCILIGPSFYFSQYLAFLNEENNECELHPPAEFRLYLIEAILSSRFSKKLYNFLEKDFIGKCENSLFIYQDKGRLNFNNCKDLSRISNSFVKFFKKCFFESNDGIAISTNDNLNKNLEKLVNKYVNIDTAIIEQLVERLNQGLPIPSIRITQNGEYEETPTYIQEIFLASWISRNDRLQPEVLNKISEFKNASTIEKFYHDFIEKPILRHDLAVLKSIQVSEWFDFYNNGKTRPDEIHIYKPLVQGTEEFEGILVDFEIRNLVLNDCIKIIPIMDIAAQIGTTSIDIRLGTGFQLFYPDQYGIIDFTDNENNSTSKNFSKRVNLDFIDGITIAPGQFLLGHSMEYIKIPDYICANLEGRSSFARLGIEIHMTAGFIDPGFEGVLTFEIYNAGPSTVKLYPGMRIGQMRFEKTKVPIKPYGKKTTVKYKGLLEHNVSRQSMDYEVNLIKDHNITNLKISNQKK